MSECDENFIRITVTLDEDASAAASKGKKYTVKLRVRIPRQTCVHKQDCTLKYFGDHEGIRELLGALKKEKQVDLVCKLAGKKRKLKPKFVRVERVDYKCERAQALLVL